jgi:hypothetical protein
MMTLRDGERLLLCVVGKSPVDVEADLGPVAARVSEN